MAETATREIILHHCTECLSVLIPLWHRKKSENGSQSGEVRLSMTILVFLEGLSVLHFWDNVYEKDL